MFIRGKQAGIWKPLYYPTLMLPMTFRCHWQQSKFVLYLHTERLDIPDPCGALRLYLRPSGVNNAARFVPGNPWVLCGIAYDSAVPHAPLGISSRLPHSI